MITGRDRIQGMILVLSASMCWGTTGTLQALAPVGAPPLTVGAIRIVLSGIILLAWCGWKNRGFGFFRRVKPVALLIGVTGMMGFQFAFFTALKLTGVSIGTMIAIGASPIVAGALGSLVEREPLSPRWALSTSVAILGCTLLVLGGSSGNVSLHWGGVGLAFLAAFCYAVMGLGLKQQGTVLPATETTAVTTGAAIAVGLPVLLLLDSSWIFSPGGAVIAFSLGFATMAFPMSLFAFGLKKIFLRDAYTISLAEPLTACILSAVVLGERLSAVSLAGAGLIFLGILLLPASEEKENGSDSAGDTCKGE